MSDVATLKKNVYAFLSIYEESHLYCKFRLGERFSLTKPNIVNKLSFLNLYFLIVVKYVPNPSPDVPGTILHSFHMNPPVSSYALKYHKSHIRKLYLILRYYQQLGEFVKLITKRCSGSFLELLSHKITWMS